MSNLLQYHFPELVMKSQVLLLFLVCMTGLPATLAVAQSDWSPEVNPSGTTFHSVRFVDANLGWAVGDLGGVLHTTNGGNEWTLQGSPTSNGLLSAYFIDSNQGWAVGGSGTIIHTTDGGLSNWVLQASPTVNTLNSTYFVDSNIGWAVGNSGTILQTTNGGVSWLSHTSPTTRILYSVHFVDATNGWLVGEGGRVYRTSNGGSSWEQQTSGVNADLFSVYFTDSANGWSVGKGQNAGGDGVILHTTNGGGQWIEQGNPTDSWLAEVCFIDLNNGWVVGGFGQRDAIAQTTNGGNQWTQQTVSTGAWFYSLRFTDANTGWTVGSGAVILHTTTGGTGTEPPNPTTLSTPLDGSSVSTDPTLSWNPAPSTLWYSLQVSTSPYFITYVANKSNITDASYDLKGLESDKTYYWRMSVTDSAGTSGWSETWNFNTSTLTGVTVDVSIDSLYMFVPAVGDTFTHELTVTNLNAFTQTVDVWTKVLRPVGDPIDPLFGPQTLVLAPFSTVTIDTAQVPVPYNAVEGNYSLVAFVGTYQSDTLGSDTTTFFKLPQIPCDSIDQFQARCRSGATVQARIVLLNSTEYAGEEVLMGIDGVNYLLTIVTNGTHSKAQTQLTGQTLGDHTVTVVSPTDCFDPVTVACTSALTKSEEEWFLDEEKGFANNSRAGAAELEMPSTTALLGNYPNPFNPRTDIGYQISDNGFVKLVVYDIVGREVTILVDGFVEAGYHQATLDGSRLASGVYHCRLTAGTFLDTRRLLLVK